MGLGSQETRLHTTSYQVTASYHCDSRDWTGKANSLAQETQFFIHEKWLHPKAVFLVACFPFHCLPNICDSASTAFCITACLVSWRKQTEPLVLLSDKQKNARYLHMYLKAYSFYAGKWNERVRAMSSGPHASFPRFFFVFFIGIWPLQFNQCLE